LLYVLLAARGEHDPLRGFLFLALIGRFLVTLW